MDAPHPAWFEQAIAEDPQDRATWQAYADWLSEQGNPHGELMQVQIALEDLALTPTGRWALQQRFEELLLATRDVILGPAFVDEFAPPNFEFAFGGAVTLPLGLHANVWTTAELEIRRGWIYRIGAPVPSRLIRKVLLFPAARLLQELFLVRDESSNLAGLSLGIKCWPALRRLDWEGPFDSAAAELCLRMTRLEHLGCEWNEHTERVVGALPKLSSYTYLATPEGGGFVPSPSCSRLARLELHECDDLDPSVLESPFLDNVRQLTIPGHAALGAHAIADQLENLAIYGGDYFHAEALAPLSELASKPGLALEIRPASIDPTDRRAIQRTCPQADVVWPENETAGFWDTVMGWIGCTATVVVFLAALVAMGASEYQRSIREAEKNQKRLPTTLSNPARPGDPRWHEPPWEPPEWHRAPREARPKAAWEELLERRERKTSFPLNP